MPGGRAPKDGEIFRNPALAQTLRDVAAHGASFTRRPLRRRHRRLLQGERRLLRRQDFAQNEPTWVEPVCTNYRGYDVWELPPNTQGIAALQMLNILEDFDLAAMGRESADFWHLLVEAKKLAYADRARYYADPAFAAVPGRRADLEGVREGAARRSST